MLAAALLLLTLRWQIPMMLWDHLDLVPIYAAWNDGALADSIFLHIHGGHVHTAAYAVLLVTTCLSQGHPWLDGAASWLLLLGYAAIAMRLARDSVDVSTRRGFALTLLIVLLALFPGHLANLQWGWQVAVFLCLFGTIATIRCLTRPQLSASGLLAAAAATLLALASFATALALVPTAVLLISLRKDWSLRKRCAASLPWLAGGIAIAWLYPAAPAVNDVATPLSLLLYVLNFLGGGIARFATPLAPWLAFAGLISGVAAAWSLRLRRDSLPWLGLFVFAIVAAGLTAFGRAAPFGADHAFVTRYVSFSSTFWLGWAGLVGCALTAATRVPAAARIFVWTIALFAVVNALHMVKKAGGVATRTESMARTIRDSYPQVDRSLLAEIYFDQPDVALERLRRLYEWGFPPFDEPRTGPDRPPNRP
ncbi:hypothetical protein [Dokdonella sp.]|uniref:hypothetical protein n=1 Tax=Dokdonella sp. TaxID=2291710 RepID=UPI001B1B255D|nr:hypothetical protein [Dokdonella sp.]MBO9664293.1 hypothetical protein [Dokdonella sp.]